MDYLSLCLIHKDENEYLEEWVRYHRLIGVERFYIYDNDSLVDPADHLRSYVEEGLVHILPVHGKAQQMTAYDHCLREFGSRSRWIGFVDTDEFILPKTTTDLRSFLQDYEGFGGLSINCPIFGSSGHLKKPAAGQIASYHLRTPWGLPENRLVKSIVQPAHAVLPFSPHHFLYKESTWCVNEAANRVDKMRIPPAAEKIQINHYWCRSAEEHERKLRRGRGDGGVPYDNDRYPYYDRLAVIEDHQINDLVIQVTGQNSLALAALGDPELTNHNPARSYPTYTPVEKRPVLAQFLDLNEQLGKMMDGKNPEQANHLIRKLIADYPSLHARWLLAENLIQQSLYQSAWDLLQDIWRSAPGHFETLLEFGLFFKTIDDLPQAEKAYSDALLLDPYGVQVRAELAEILVREKKMIQALGLVLECIELFPYFLDKKEYLDMINRLGVYAYSHEEPERAVQLLENAYRYHPDDYDLLINLGKIYYDQKKDILAKKLLERAVRVNPKDSEARLGLDLIRKRKKPLIH
jgi:tetratricopeptide (TPR) repeat protein